LVWVLYQVALPGKEYSANTPCDSIAQPHVDVCVDKGFFEPVEGRD